MGNFRFYKGFGVTFLEQKEILVIDCITTK